MIGGDINEEEVKDQQTTTIITKLLISFHVNSHSENSILGSKRRKLALLHCCKERETLHTVSITAPFLEPNCCLYD